MTSNPSRARPQLLVSVQNPSEAELALRLGVPWIDLKNPAQGSLGCPAVATARSVARILNAPSLPADALPADGQASDRVTTPCQTSVALGELKSLELATARELMQLFPIAKVGLAGLATDTAALRGSLDELARGQRSPGQLVLAAYADHQRAAAPAPAAVVELAQQLGSRYVLVDTCVKDGRGLFHWQSRDQLAHLGQQAANFGAQLVVAGSLTSADWPELRAAAPIIGVRGGVCTGDRAGQLCPRRIAEWLQWTSASGVS